MSTRRPIGAVDTIWLNMDRPNNLMIVDSFMWFETPLDHDRVASMLQTRLVDRFPVFSQRAVDPPIPFGPPHWEDDPHFDLDRHLIRARLPEPGGDAELQAYLEEQIPNAFDRAHPLWEFHLIDGYGQGCALMTRFHHALADGAALMEVLLSLTDATPDAGPTTAEDDDEPPDEPMTAPGGLLGAATRAAQAASTAGMAAGVAAGRALHLLGGLPHLADPHTLIDALTLTQQTGQITGKLLLASNPAGPLRGVPGVTKRLAWSAPRALDDVKSVGRLAGATVNDVLVSTLSAALARYLADRGAAPVDLNTMVPVNLRAPGEPLPRELGNKFALVFLTLPSGDHAPLERLALAKARMDAIKNSPEAGITFGLIKAIGHTNPEIERVLVDFFSNKAIGVTTNVPGPIEQRYVTGVPLAGVLGWVPGAGHQSIGACILTYHGTVRVGFKVDADLVPDPEKLVDAFDRSIEDLLRMTDRHGSRHRDRHGSRHRD